MLSGPSGVVLCYPVWFAARLQIRHVPQQVAAVNYLGEAQ